MEERDTLKLAAFLKAPAVSLDSILDAGFWEEGVEMGDSVTRNLPQRNESGICQPITPV